MDIGNLLGMYILSGNLWLLLYFLYYIIISIGADRKQDEELDELSISVQRIGGVGLTIHEELVSQVDLRDFCSMIFAIFLLQKVGD